MATTPLICHLCWPKKQNHAGPCEHALFVYEQGRLAGVPASTPDAATVRVLKAAERSSHLTWNAGEHEEYYQATIELRDALAALRERA